MCFTLFFSGSSSVGEFDVSCKLDEIQCPNGLCVDIESRCNGINECPDGFDEINCGKN